MSSNGKGIRRREFLKRGGLAALGTLLGGSLIKVSYAASRDRVTALSSIGLDTLHPYAHSSSPQYGIWNNMIEPLAAKDAEPTASERSRTSAWRLATALAAMVRRQRDPDRAGCTT